MIKRILEIGVAVRNLAQSSRKFRFILGGREGNPLTAREYAMTAQMIRVGNIEFELMEPLGQEGLIENFIRSRGQGLHHIAFQVDDMARTISGMQNFGIKMIDAKPIWAHGVKAAFIHPESFGGVLFELIEGSPKWVDDRPLPIELQEQSPIRGVGTEGILAVGVFVEDVTAAARHYAAAFCATASKIINTGDRLPQVCICRVGNVDLVLFQMPESESEKNTFFEKKRPGLHHIVMKVENLERSANYLKNHGVDFTSVRVSAFSQTKVLSVNAGKLSGVPVLLTDNLSDSTYQDTIVQIV
jgi:methylmalonyl-CoA/ethylmalonyl-CoA epimerase